MSNNDNTGHADDGGPMKTLGAYMVGVATAPLVLKAMKPTLQALVRAAIELVLDARKMVTGIAGDVLTSGVGNVATGAVDAVTGGATKAAEQATDVVSSGAEKLAETASSLNPIKNLPNPLGGKKS